MSMTDAVTPKVLSTPPPSQSLDGLAKEINEALTMMATSFQNSVKHAINAGLLLSEAKNRVGHGNFESWLTQHCKLSFRTARRYMKLAERRKEIEAKSATLTDLSLGDAYKLIGPAKATNVAPSSTPTTPSGEPQAVKREVSKRMKAKQVEAFKKMWNDFEDWQQRSFVKRFKDRLAELLEEVENEGDALAEP